MLLECRRSKIPLQVVCLVVLTNDYQTTRPRSMTPSGILAIWTDGGHGISRGIEEITLGNFKVN